MSRRFRSRVLAGLAGLALLAFGAGSAQAATTVHIKRNATLAARGAVVKVVVVVTCDAPKPAPRPHGTRAFPTSAPGPAASLYVDVTQRVGKFVANGFGSADDVECDGKAHKVPVWVTPYNRAFARGVAFARARLSSWYEDDVDVSDSRKITIH